MKNCKTLNIVSMCLKNAALVAFAILAANCSAPNNGVQKSKNNIDLQFSVQANASFPAFYSNILSVSCANCHTPGGQGPNAGSNLDFTSQETAFSTLLNSSVSGNSTAGNCGQVRLVQPGHPETSYLVEQFSSAYTVSSDFVQAGCSPYSGHATSLLNDDEQAALVAWVQSGARNN